MRCISTLLLVSVLIGCDATTSPNLELAAIRSVGDVSVSSILDNSSDDALEKRKEDMGKYILAVADFVGKGDPAGLIQSVLLDHLKEIQKTLKIPSYLGPLMEDLIDSLKKKNVEDQVEKIGKRNVLRIRAFLFGALQGVKRYQDDLREKPAPAPAPAPEPADDPAPAEPVSP